MLLQIKSNVIYAVKTIEEKSLRVEPDTKNLYGYVLHLIHTERNVWSYTKKVDTKINNMLQ